MSENSIFLDRDGNPLTDPDEIAAAYEAMLEDYRAMRPSIMRANEAIFSDEEEE